MKNSKALVGVSAPYEDVAVLSSGFSVNGFVHSTIILSLGRRGIGTKLCRQFCAIFISRQIQVMESKFYPMLAAGKELNQLRGGSKTTYYLPNASSVSLKIRIEPSAPPPLGDKEVKTN